jgi:hypothetical protein
MRRFQRLYAERLHELGVEVPTVVDDLVSCRVLVTHWIDGTPQRQPTPTLTPHPPTQTPHPNPNPQPPNPNPDPNL